MSYLVLPGGIPNFSKAVISLWFRVPQYSIDKVRAEFEPRSPRLFNGIIPLMVFGAPIKKKEVDFLFVPFPGGYTVHYMQYEPDCTYHETRTENVKLGANQWKLTGNEEIIDPSYIAIDCTHEEALLSVNIQMQDSATLGGSFEHEVATSSPADVYMHAHPTAYPGCSPPATKPDGSVAPFNEVVFDHKMASNAAVEMGCRPELFRLLPAINGQQFSQIDVDFTNGQTVTPNHWHHLLLSFDLSYPCSTTGLLNSFPDPHTQGSRTTSACKMWLAFDDKNLTEKKLSTYWPSGYNDPNAILTVNAFYQASSRTGIPTVSGDDNWGNIIKNVYSGSTAPSCEYSPTPVPTAGHAIGLPASAAHTANICKVEMAELQVFTGINLETGNVANRRAFIDVDGKPVNPTKAKERLGQSPAILLHGNTKWKAGTNTGTAGKFQRQGIVNIYKPEPSLHGPQSPPPPKSGPVQLTRAAADAGL